MKKWPRGLRCFLWFLCQGQKELLSKYVPGAPWLVLNKLSRNYGLLMENSRPLILLESLYGKTAIILVKETRFQLLFISVHPMTEYRDQGINIISVSVLNVSLSMRKYYILFHQYVNNTLVPEFILQS